MSEITIDGKSYSQEEVLAIMSLGMKAAGLSDQQQQAQKENWIQAPHGRWGDNTTGGLFVRPGVEPEMFSAIRYPGAELISRLWAGVTDVRETEYAIVTGVDAAIGDNAADFCDTAPTAGFARLCTTRAQFGEFKMQTEQINIAQNGGRITRADVDRRVINRPEAYPLTPMVGYDNMNTTLGLAYFRLGIHTQRVIERVMFSGSIANTGSNAQKGFIREFNGFDQLIKTGHVDLESGLFCESADSIIRDYNNVNISSGSSNIVTEITGTYRLLRDRSDQGGMGDMWEGFVAMTPDMFYAITAVWPCNYLTNGCAVTTASGERLNVDSSQQVAMRDEMRTGNFLWVDGERLPVYTTRAIEQTTQGLGFSAPIYFINTSAMGMRTTFVEAFDMGNTSNTEILGLVNSPRVLNGGVYLTGRTYGADDLCFAIVFAAKFRMIMRTPWLCARIENVVFVLDQYSNSPYPEDPYYVNGGRYVSEGPTIYS